MARARIIIASPNPLIRNRMARALATLPEVEVIATAADLSETFTLTEAREPDLVILGSDFVRIDDFGAMKTLFYAVNTRWLELVQDHRLEGNCALSPGTGKPETEPLIDVAMGPTALLFQVKRALATRRVAAAATPTVATWERTVLIGSSTGGVDALLTLLAAFPADCPPTAVVQHTGKGFSESLVRLLARRSRPHVVAARDGMAMGAGKVVVAAGTEGHFHLTPGQPLQCRIQPGAPVSGHMPSVDELFRSALPLAAAVVAVILTGMGQDGAAGLLDLRRAGALTLGQDEASSVVYGMPKAAWDRGAVQEQYPIQRLGAEILRRAAMAPARPLSSRAVGG